jgi:hypothetical protein
LAVSTAGSGPQPPQSSFPERLITIQPRRAWLVGLTLWGSAALALALHAYGLALPDPTRFAVLECWLLSLGCLGCPILAMRAPGRHLTVYTCVLIGAVSFTIAVLLTALTLVGEMRPHAISGTFGLILPLALGLHAINAADVERRGTREHAAAYQAARIDALTDTLDARYAALAGLERLEQMELPALEALADIVAAHIAARTVEPRSLHLVAQSDEHDPGREPIARRCAPSYHLAAAEQRGSPTRNRPPQARGNQSDLS